MSTWFVGSSFWSILAIETRALERERFGCVNFAVGFGSVQGRSQWSVVWCRPARLRGGRIGWGHSRPYLGTPDATSTKPPTPLYAFRSKLTWICKYLGGFIASNLFWATSEIQKWRLALIENLSFLSFLLIFLTQQPTNTLDQQQRTDSNSSNNNTHILHSAAWVLILRVLDTNHLVLACTR